MLDLGRAFYIREQVSDAARAALRASLQATQKSTADAACAAGGKVTVVLPATSSSIATIAAAASEADSPTGTPSGTNLSGATMTVTWHCVSGIAVTNATNGGITDPANPRSDSVDVLVQYPVALLYPIIQQIAGPVVTVSAHEVGRVEY